MKEININHLTHHILTIAAGLLLLTGCTPSLPKDTDKCMHKPHLSVDIDSAVLPPNIAPMNFRIEEKGDDYRAHFWSEANHEGFVVEGAAIDIDEDRWHELLDATKGKTLHCDIYVAEKGKWTQYLSVVNPIATDSIDPFITYRLIEPGYVDYEEMSINQRSLTSFDEQQVYNNRLLSDGGQNGQCMNCHTPRNYNRDGRSMMHVRQLHGGTVFVDGNHLTKVNLKTDSTLSAGVYPAWHPTLDLIAFSTNSTGQSFHTRDAQKIEVIDYGSDLILYDISSNTVYDIDKRKDEYESFPTWSPNGQTLYYIAAHHEQQTAYIDTELNRGYQELHYNIYCRHFDPKTHRFGDRQLVFDAAALGKSAAQPRLSPDGRWLLFSLADYGQFHVWHESADLWAIDLTTQKASALKAVNSKRMESYHCWSSNGRWILFTSRRDDGNYTRLYMAYFDRQGRVHKAFPLPQRRTDYYENLFKSYNTPEFLVRPVEVSMSRWATDICRDPVQAKYGGSALLHPEGYDVTRPDSINAPQRKVGY